MEASGHPAWPRAQQGPSRGGGARVCRPLRGVVALSLGASGEPGRTRVQGVGAAAGSAG